MKWTPIDEWVRPAPVPKARSTKCRRGSLLAFRATEAEAILIRALAARRNVSVSALIRTAALREVEASR